jgi:hypothetical protein
MPALAIVFVMAWVNGSTADWAAGWSFGGRRFTSCLVLLAPGLAFLIERLLQRPMLVLSGLGLVAVGWNQLLLAQYRENLIALGQPVSFAQIVRQQATVLTRPPFVYPFAFPANVWFAWRTGLPIERYDLLAPAPLKSSLDLTFGADAGPFLIDGWGARGAEPGGELRWLEGERSELVVPLDLPDGLVRVVVQARTRLVDPPARVSLAIVVNGRRVGSFEPDAQAPSTAEFTIPVRDAFTRGFNRILFEKDHGDGRSAPVAIYRLQAAPVP